MSRTKQEHTRGSKAGTIVIIVVVAVLALFVLRYLPLPFTP